MQRGLIIAERVNPQYSWCGALGSCCLYIKAVILCSWQGHTFQEWQNPQEKCVYSCRLASGEYEDSLWCWLRRVWHMERMEGPSVYFCAAILLISHQLSTYICHSGHLQGQKDEVNHSRTLVLLEPPEEHSGSSWQRCPGMSPGCILWVAEGGALTNSWADSK